MRLFSLFFFVLLTNITFGQGILKLDHDTIFCDTVFVKVDTNGRLIEPTYVKVSFPFKNTGNEPLIIGSCRGNGKGIIKVPQEPIKQGAKSNIDVTFGPSNHDGDHKLEFSIPWYRNNILEEKKIYIYYYRKTLSKT